MPIRQVGGGSPIQGRANVSRDRINGDTVRWTWRGIYSDLLALQTTLALDANNTQTFLSPDSDGVLGTLEQIRAQTNPDGNPEVPLDTLELNWFDQEISLWFAPRFAVLSGSDRGVVIKAFNRYSDDGTYPAFTTGPGPYQVTNFQVCTEAFVHLNRGEDRYKQRVATLSWTRAASLGFAGVVNQAHMSEIWTTTNLQAYLTTNSLSPKLFTLASVAPPTFVPDAFYAAGWMKKEASLNVGANGKGLMREAWEFGVWSSSMYPIF